MNKYILCAVFLLLITSASAQWQIEQAALELPEYTFGQWINDSSFAVVADNKEILISYDYGTTFETYPTTESIYIYSAHFMDENTAWVFRTENDTYSDREYILMYTNDRGITWKQYNHNRQLSYEGYINQMHFFNENEGILINDHGLCFLTRNAGETLVKMPHAEYKNMVFSSDSVGYVCLYDYDEDAEIIIKTTDAGKTWNKTTYANNQYQYSINSMSALSNDSVLIAGENNILHMTTNGGGFWNTIYNDGYDIDKLFWIEDSTIIIRQSSSMYISHDLGKNYQILNRGYYNSLNDMAFNDKDCILGYGINGLLFRLFSDFSQGELLQQGPNQLLYKDILFIDKNSGILKAQNKDKSYFTYDGGKFWTRHARDLDGLDIDHSGYLSYIHSKQIHYSTDTMKTWNIMQFPDSLEDLDQVYFLDSLNIFAIGRTYKNDGTGFGYITYQTIFKSTNGGSTWYYVFDDWVAGKRKLQNTSQTKDFTYYKNNIYCFNHSNLLRTFYNYRGKYSRDGGKSWKDLPHGTITFDICMVDSLHGFACGGKRFSKTTDGGETWHSAAIISNQLSDVEFYSISFPDPQNGYAVGSHSSIYRTTNGGNTWQKQHCPVDDVMLTGVSFVDQYNGWICGDESVLLKTTNGGVTFIDVSETNTPSGFTLHTNYPNPFNPVTTIQYDLPERSFVTLTVYNTLGETIKTLVNSEQYAGVHSIQFDASDVPSGVYFYRLQTSDFVETKKMLLVK